MLPLLLLLLAACLGAAAEDGLALYTDVAPVNATDSLLRIKGVPFKVYEFKYDSVVGRKQVGVLGQDAQRFFPDAVEVVAVYPVKSANIVLHNFPVVDKNVIFVHGLAALQELVRLVEGVEAALVAVRASDEELRASLARVDARLADEQCSQTALLEKIAALEARIKEKTAVYEGLLRREQSVLGERALADEREVQALEQRLARERAAEEEARVRQELEAALDQERALAQRREELRQATERDLLERRSEAASELARERARLSEEGVRSEVRARAEAERANEDVALRRIRLQASLDSQRAAEGVAEVSRQLGRLLADLLAEPLQLARALGLLLLALLAYHALREALLLLRALVQARLGRPSLVRETSVLPLLSLAYWLRPSPASSAAAMRAAFADVVLCARDKQAVLSVAVSTRNSRANGVPFRHLLLYGPPGTGKTLIARKLAAASGLDYAVMSGGDVGPLGDDAVTQLHALFRWAGRSARGLLVFIDEAEAFLARREQGGAPRHALNALLFQTGTQSRSFMLVLATNRPEDLDAAVLDRVDVTLRIPLPEASEREQLVRFYHQQHFAEAGTRGGLFSFAARKLPSVALTDEAVARMAELTAGFSGREVSKLFVACQYAALGSGGALTEELLWAVLEGRLREHGALAALAHSDPRAQDPGKQPREEPREEPKEVAKGRAVRSRKPRAES